MRLYPGTIDETQRIENVFGILAARPCIFCEAIQADIKTVEVIVQACTCLHNFLQLTAKSAYSPKGFIDSRMGLSVQVTGAI